MIKKLQCVKSLGRWHESLWRYSAVSAAVVMTGGLSSVHAQEPVTTQPDKASPASAGNLPLTRSQNLAADDKANATILDMTPQVFHRWLEERRKETIRQVPKTPMDIERGLSERYASVMQRLKANRPVSDESFMLVADEWFRLEHNNRYVTRTPDTPRPTFKETLRLLDALLPYAVGRPYLEAQLRFLKAQIFFSLGDKTNQIKEYDEIQRLLEPLQYDIEKRRMITAYLKGEALSYGSEGAKADPEFRKVLSFPWYQVKDPDVMYEMVDYYVRAARGLIRIHRDNPEVLKSLRFTPGVMEELRHEIQSAIARAEGKPLPVPLPTRLINTAAPPGGTVPPMGAPHPVLAELETLLRPVVKGVHPGAEVKVDGYQLVARYKTAQFGLHSLGKRPNPPAPAGRAALLFNDPRTVEGPQEDGILLEISLRRDSTLPAYLTTPADIQRTSWTTHYNRYNLKQLAIPDVINRRPEVVTAPRAPASTERPEYVDLQRNQWMYDAMEWLGRGGIIEYSGDRGRRAMVRYEFAVTIARLTQNMGRSMDGSQCLFEGGEIIMVGTQPAAGGTQLDIFVVPGAFTGQTLNDTIAAVKGRVKVDQFTGAKIDHALYFRTAVSV